MNSVHEQCPNSDYNSALNQNWVRCIVRTPRAQVASTLRAQCPGRGCCCAHSKQVARVSRAQLAQVVHRSRSCWACTSRNTPRQPAPGRDLKTGSLLRFPCQIQSQVATSFQGRDLLDDQARSRHQPHVATSLPPSQTNQVATSKMGSRLQFPTGQVATSIPCRDLLETNLCRDIDFMSRLRSCP